MGGGRSLSRPMVGSCIARLCLVVVSLLTIGAWASQVSGVSVQSSGGSNADIAAAQQQDVICSNDSTDDCYPRIFQATHNFEVVREGQEIPPGLHIRLDMSTGKKEAKINDPNEQIQAVEGLPVDSSVVVVESDESDNNVVSVPKGAPAYEPVGKIKPPETESQAFRDSLTVLKTLSLDDRPLDAALSILTDISHDIYYGLKVAEDSNAVTELLCMMSNQEIFGKDVNEEQVKLAGDAASVIGSALQNNQKALVEVEKAWPVIRDATCSGSDKPLKVAAFQMLIPSAATNEDTPGSEGHQLSLTKAKTSALRGLIKSALIRDDFLASGGMEQILQVLKRTRPDLEPAQQKLANLVMDNFLDEGMGAVLGVWPRPGSIDLDWNTELKKLAKLYTSKKGHWSTELWKILQGQRQAMNAAGVDGKPEHSDL
ncbi:hypothetical protein BD289DRAFT_442405 [Coniella lustricola]|uniref:Nucleotide exchange factor SIL1 n=1 Tax=Coniella lustricola TaxID=2025994 RepID=A0A2T2ZY94_9PEZI|nr:hypothetical protein BD289DRAFT_442405 [Coniella lustricola]